MCDASLSLVIRLMALSKKRKKNNDFSFSPNAPGSPEVLSSADVAYIIYHVLLAAGILQTAVPLRHSCERQ